METESQPETVTAQPKTAASLPVEEIKNSNAEEKTESFSAVEKPEEIIETKQETPIEKLRSILVSAGKKAQEKGIKIKNGKFFSLSRSGLQITECCILGAAHLSLGDEGKTKELAKKPKLSQETVISALRANLLKEYSNINIVDIIEGFDSPDWNYDSPSPFILLGQELCKQFMIEAKNVEPATTA